VADEVVNWLVEHLPTREPGWTTYDWVQIFAFKAPEAPKADKIIDVPLMYVTPGTNEEYVDTDFVALMLLDDFTWATVHAGNDTTGWGCHGDHVRWYRGNTFWDAVTNGLTNESRRWLGFELVRND
jgi:hypothetical protein